MTSLPASSTDVSVIFETPADAEVAEERLRGDEGDRHLVAYPPLLERVVHLEGELVRGAEATSSGSAADHHRSRVVQEAPPGFACLHRLARRHQGVSRAVDRAPPGNRPRGATM